MNNGVCKVKYVIDWAVIRFVCQVDMESQIQ